jgi:hypothetical protein
MAKRKVYHVTFHKNEGWFVKLEKTDVVISSHKLKDDAVDMACHIARANEPSQVKIHHQDGTFEREVTYGNDPFPPYG